MELVKIKVPYWFIKSVTTLTWREARFGLEEEILAPKSLSEMAADCMLEQNSSEIHDETEHLLIDLASAAPDEPIRDVLDQLALQSADQPLEWIQRKWAYVLLAWVFENRHAIDDPLTIVEYIYADLGYPEQVSPMVRYMPATCKEPNESKMFKDWEEYLKEERELFG